MMKAITVTILLLYLFQLCSSLQSSCLPSSVQSDNALYVAYNNDMYKYSLPDLNITLHKSYSHKLCPPGSFSADQIIFALDPHNLNSTAINTSNLSVASKHQGGPSPQGSYPYFSKYGSGCVYYAGDNYCYSYDPSSKTSWINRVSNGVPVENLKLEKNDTSSFYMSIDPYVSNRIHFTTQTCTKNGCSGMTYYSLNIKPLALASPPINLPHTESNNCPLKPLDCTVEVLLDFHIRNDIVTWLWSVNSNGNTKITVQAYDATCNVLYATALGESSNAVPGRCVGPNASGSSLPSPIPSSDLRSDAMNSLFTVPIVLLCFSFALLL